MEVLKVCKPNDWPHNNREINIEDIFNATVRFYSEPSFANKERLFSLIDITDLNEINESGEEHICDYEITLIRLLFFRREDLYLRRILFVLQSSGKHGYARPCKGERGFSANITHRGEDVLWVSGEAYGGLIRFVPEDPVLDGYAFEGWYKDERGREKWDFSSDRMPFPAFRQAGRKCRIIRYIYMQSGGPFRKFRLGGLLLGANTCFSARNGLQ